MTLPAETYTNKSLTDMELEALALIEAHRKLKRDAFKSPKGPLSELPTTVPIAEPAEMVPEAVQHDTLPPPEKEHDHGSEEGEEGGKEESNEGEVAAGDEDTTPEVATNLKVDIIERGEPSPVTTREEAAVPNEEPAGKAEHGGVACDGCRVRIRK